MKSNQRQNPMASYDNFLKNYFTMRHFNNGMSLDAQEQLKKWVDNKNADKSEVKTWNTSIYSRITEDFNNQASPTEIINQRKILNALKEFQEFGYLNGYTKGASEESIKDLQDKLKNLEKNDIIKSYKNTENEPIISNILSNINNNNINVQLKQLALLQNNICTDLLQKYKSIYKDKDFRSKWLEEKLNELGKFTQNDKKFSDKDFTKQYLQLNKLSLELSKQSKAKEPLNSEELNDLYSDLWNVFDNLRKKVNNPNISPDVVEFFTKYGNDVSSLFPPKPTLDNNEQDNLLQWFSGEFREAFFGYFGAQKASEILKNLNKHKIGKSNSEIKEFLQAYSYSEPTAKEFLDKIKAKEQPTPENLNKFSTELPEILDTIYTKKDIAEAIKSNGSNEIVSPMEEIKSENDFSKLPEKMKYPKTPFQKAKDKVEEKVLDEFLYKFTKRHYRHAYKSESAKSIVGAMVKNGITPDQGLEAWLKLEPKLNPEQKKDWDKLKWFLEKLQKDDKKLFDEALSSPDRLNFIASQIIKYTVSGEISENNAKAMLETFGVMRYGMFDFYDRKAKFKEFWSEKTELVKGLSLFKGNAGAEAVGKVADWMAKLCFAGVVNAVALGRNLGKQAIARIRQSGQKEINAMTGQQSSQISEVSDTDRKKLKDLEQAMTAAKTKTDELNKNLDKYKQELQKIENDIQELNSIMDDEDIKKDGEKELRTLESKKANIQGKIDEIKTADKVYQQKLNDYQITQNNIKGKEKQKATSEKNQKTVEELWQFWNDVSSVKTTDMRPFVKSGKPYIWQKKKQQNQAA